MKETLFYVLAFALVLPGVAALNLSQNETLNYTYVSNQTYELFYCAAHNESMCSQQNFTINLLAGQTYNSTNGSCSVAASCTSISAGNNATCIVNRVLQPGESIYTQDGACQLNITQNYTAPQEVPQRVNVTVKKVGDTVHITIGGKGYDIPLNGNFEYSQLLEPVCPVVPTFQETDDIDYLVKQCRSWVPMLDDTITTLVANTKTCSESARTHVDDIKSCGDRERTLMQQKGDIEVQVSGLIKERDAALAAEVLARSEKGDEIIRADTNKALSWLWFICWMLTALFLGFFLVTSRTRQVRT